MQVVSRSLDEAAIAAHRAAHRADDAGEIGEAVRPHDQRAAIAAAGSVGLDRGAAHRDVRGVPRRPGAVQIAADMHCAAAGRARGVDPGVVGDCDVMSADVDEAAGLAVAVAGSGDRAAHIHIAVAAVDHDFAVLQPGAGRGDDAGVVDHRAGDVRRCACGHDHTAAIVGLDRAGVGDACLAVIGLAGRCRDGVAQQIVAVEIDREGARAAEHHGAGIGLDQALIVDDRARQDDGAAIAGADRALVDDRGTGAAAEAETAIGEVAVRNVRRRGEEAADIHLRAAAEQDAVAVDQPDLAVGQNAAIDRGWRRADDAIERDRSRARLVEAHRTAGRDRKTVPVDQRAIGRLVDGGRTAIAVDRRGTGNDSAAGGIGFGRAEAEHGQATGAQ